MGHRRGGQKKNDKSILYSFVKNVLDKVLCSLVLPSVFVDSFNFFPIFETKFSSLFFPIVPRMFFGFISASF